jgi:Carboxylesterase family
MRPVTATVHLIVQFLQLLFEFFSIGLRHAPPAPPEEPYVENLGKDLGSYHGAELAYVFANFVPREWAWTETDRDFARIISRYWVNFAATGDPMDRDCLSGRYSIQKQTR